MTLQVHTDVYVVLFLCNFIKFLTYCRSLTQSSSHLSNNIGICGVYRLFKPVRSFEVLDLTTNVVDMGD